MTPAWTFAKSVAAFISDGCTTVTREQYEERLTICATCPVRRGSKCGKCRCILRVKAKGRAWKCPLGKWPSA